MQLDHLLTMRLEGFPAAYVPPIIHSPTSCRLSQDPRISPLARSGAPEVERWPFGLSTIRSKRPALSSNSNVRSVAFVGPVEAAVPIVVIHSYTPRRALVSFLLSLTREYFFPFTLRPIINDNGIFASIAIVEYLPT